MREETSATMLAAVQAFHDKLCVREDGGEGVTDRIALMAEKLGDISACVNQ